MNLTAYSDYALRVLIYLNAHRERPEPVTIQAVANAYGISKAHLMKVVNQLSQLGYVEATRGRGGGLRLVRPASTVNLGEVVRATEPHFNLVECFGPENRCPIVPACGLRDALQEARAAFLAVLDRYNLEDLSRQRENLLALWRERPGRPSLEVAD